MIRFHKIFSVLWSAAFLIILQEFSIPRPVFRFLLAGFLVFAALLTWYNWRYLVKIEKYTPWVLVRPLLFFASAFALFQIIPVDFLRGVFLLISFCFGVAVEYFLGSFAESMLLNETLIIAFGIFMSACAYALQYFPSLQTLYLAAVFIGIMLVTRAFFEFSPQPDLKKLSSAVAIALFCTETFWALSFLPLHFSAIALLLFNVFYFCLILQYYFVFNNLNVRKFQLHILIFTLSSLFIFFITPWKILVS